MGDGCVLTMSVYVDKLCALAQTAASAIAMQRSAGRDLRDEWGPTITTAQGTRSGDGAAIVARWATSSAEMVCRAAAERKRGG